MVGYTVKVSPFGILPHRSSVRIVFNFNAVYIFGDGVKIGDDAKCGAEAERERGESKNTKRRNFHSISTFSVPIDSLGPSDSDDLFKHIISYQ